MNNQSGGSGSGGGGGGVDEMMGGGEEFYVYNHNGSGLGTTSAGEEDGDDVGSHNTEITLLGGSQTNLDKQVVSASPGLLKKFSKIKLHHKKVTSSEKKTTGVVKVNSKATSVGGSGNESVNSRYFKKFKFKKTNKSDEATKLKEKWV